MYDGHRYLSSVLEGSTQDGHLVSECGVRDALLEEPVVFRPLLIVQRVTESTTSVRLSVLKLKDPLISVPTPMSETADSMLLLETGHTDRFLY